MKNSLKTIKQYVLNPDHVGCHLRQMAEKMAASMAEKDVTRAGAKRAAAQEIRHSCLDRAAETIARFINLLWDGSGPQEYAPRTLEILLRLQGRMRGMDPDSTWAYAIDFFNVDIVSRLSNRVASPIINSLKKTSSRVYKSTRETRSSAWSA